MQGIGDQIYARPFIKALASLYPYNVYVESVLPLLYVDLPVHFVKPESNDYRTQKKNELKTTYKPIPSNATVIDWKYGRSELMQHGIVAHLANVFNIEYDLISPNGQIKFDLPFLSDGLEFHQYINTTKKIAIVRPVTIRKEWSCTSRAPNPDYINWCARILKDSGYHVISIADCVEGEEWIEGDEPVCDVKLHKGELGIYSTLQMMSFADIVVGGSGFIIPASLATNTNLFVIFGGRGGYDNPHKVFDPRMNLKKIGWAIPDNFCRCKLMSHDCDKTITNLDDKFFAFLKQI